MDREIYKSVIEALIFTSDKPINLEQIKNVFEDIDSADIRSLIEELKSDFETNKRGLRITEVAGGFQMITAPNLVSYLKKYYKQRQSEKLTSPSLETLAIIAYKQPVTRLEIESIRGVNVDGVIKSLTEKNLIRIAGRKNIIGRPFVYGTTRQFLEYFGLKSLEELPKMEEFANLVAKETQESSATPGVIEQSEEQVENQIQNLTAEDS